MPPNKFLELREPLLSLGKKQQQVGKQIVLLSTSI